jgi:TctA family transporter
MLLRPAGAEGVDRVIAAIFLLQIIVILSFMGLAQRYLAEFFPFLIFTFLIFLREGKIAFQLRYLFIGLVGVSALINSLTTVSWLVEADMNVPAATKAKWNQFLGRTSRS